MERGERVRNAVLLEVVARRHFSAKAVAAMRDGHLCRRVRSRLNQNRHVQPRKSQGVGNRALVAEIRKRNDDAVDLVARGFEQRGAALGFLVGFDSAVFAGLRTEGNHVHSCRLENLDHLLAAGLGQMVGEESAVSHDQAHRHLGCSHRASALRLCRMRPVREIVEQTLTECTTADFLGSCATGSPAAKRRKTAAVVGERDAGKSRPKSRAGYELVASRLRAVDRGVILEVATSQGVGASLRAHKALASR